VASVLREENKHELLRRIQGKSQREIDAIAARYRPPIALRDRVRPVKVVVAEPTAAAHGVSGAARPASREGGEGNFAHNGQSRTLTDCAAKGNGSGHARHPRTEQKLLIQFLANEAFMEKYEEARALLSQRLSDTSFEKVFEALVEGFLERHCPLRRKARRNKKKSTISKPRRVTAKKRPDPAKALPLPKPKPRSRHIPAAVRDKVFARDDGRCTYVGKTGRRCGCKQALQIDHVRPFTRGGTHTISNLRLLCAKHNRLAAQEAFGEKSMERWQPRD